jgi:hypothetical protein
MRRILIPAPATFDLLEYERDVFIDEILKRTRLLLGQIDPTLNRFGIVDSLDPTTALEGDSRPFVVRVNSTDSTTVDVLGGTAVFHGGEIIELEDGASRLAVPGGVGTKSVVYLFFDELETDPVLTRYDTLGNARVDFLALDSGYIKITTRSDFDALSSTDLEKAIPLAQITVQEVASGAVTTTELVVDMDDSALATNRPWFSVVDIQHRSFIGSGVQSDQNPHGLSFNDISATGDFSIFQMHLDHGMILSKDETLAKVPGKLCQETILAAAITQDTTGAVTGVVDAMWFRTSNFPTQVLRATDPSFGLDLAPVHITRTNLVFLLPNDEYTFGTTNLVVYYTTTDACEPPTELPQTSLTFKAAGDREAIITDGVVLDDVTNPLLTFEDAGPTPQRYTVYLDEDGAFQRYPQTCFCFKKLTVFGFTLQTFDQAIRGLGRLKVALTNAVAGPTLDVQIQITGKDSAGAIITETVQFDSTWVGVSVGKCEEGPLQFVRTTNFFSELTNFIVTTNVDSGPDAALTIFGDINPRDTEAIADVLPVVEVFWDGLQVCSLDDIRPINTTMHLPRVTKHAAAALPLSETTLVFRPGFMFNFWVEDFDRPKFITTEFTDASVGVPALTPQKTDMRKIVEGLDKFDQYVGKPIAVRPHTSSPSAIRFVPIEQDESFELFARYFDGTGSWTDWTPLSGFLLPQYTLDLAGATSPLIKWQVVVRGQCKGLITVYVTDGVGLGGAFVFDVGVWDNGTYS